MTSGFTGDGQMLWQSSAFPFQSSSTYQFLADGSGGLLMLSDNADVVAVADIDGQSGAQAWQANIIVPGGTSPAVGPDGGIYTWAIDPNFAGGVLVKLDPQSGQSTTLAAIPYLNVISSCNGFTFVISSNPPEGLSPIVDNQGNVFVTYFALNGSDTLNCQGMQVGTGSMIGVLLKIAPDGSGSTFNVFSNPVASGASDNFGGIIPDGQGGAFVVWNQTPAGSNDEGIDNPNFITNSTTGSNYPSPLIGSFFPLVVLGENNTLVESDGTTVAALNSVSGQVQWTYQPAAGVATLVATHGGGVTVFDGGQNQISIDPQGNASTPISLGSPQSVQLSLLGQVDGISSSGIVQMLAAPLFDFADGSWDLQGGGSQVQTGGPVQGGGPVQNGHAQPLPYEAPLAKAPLPSCQGAPKPCAGDALENAFSSLQTVISGSCPKCQTFVFSKSQLGLTQSVFGGYLGLTHQFYDATRSHAKAGEVLCTKHSVFNIFAPACNVSPGQQSLEIVKFWDLSGNPAAITKTPSAKGEGLITFWDPSQVNLALGNTVQAVGNQSAIFHEGLHGETGIIDTAIGTTSLQGTFGICLDDTSFSISEYISFYVFGVGSAPTNKQTSNGTCLTWTQ